MSYRQQFIDEINNIVLTFPGNTITKKINSSSFSMSDYHDLLLSMLLVSYEAPATSALAAANCPHTFTSIKNTLLQNATDGANHWQWILDDLAATGYQGVDPFDLMPSPATQAYVGYNYYIATRHPIARLGIIAAIESISRNFSSNYSSKVFQKLALKSSQATFFFRRNSETTSLETILRVLDEANISAQEWQWVMNATRTAGFLYRAIYDAQKPKSHQEPHHE